MMQGDSFQLPVGVQDALSDLAKRWASRGIIVSMFGSFARGTGRRDSDIDLAIEWGVERNERLWQEFLNDIDALPTVRKIDVVDLHTADRAFSESIRPLLRRVA